MVKPHGKHGRVLLMILITGGLGYLGARIASHLISQGLAVRLGSSRVCPQIPVELNSCEIVHTDFMEQASLDNACHGIDTIIHLAGMNAAACKKNPDKAINVKGIGTQRLLLSAKLHSIKRIIYFSTVHVYGAPLSGAINENTLPRPMHPYSISHRLAEDLVLEAKDKIDADCIVFRLSNAVGAPINAKANCWDLVVNDLCKQVALNGEMKLNSNRKILRDYVGINYICDVMWQVISDNCISNLMSGRILNLSSGESINLGDLVGLIKEHSKTTLGFIPISNFSKLQNENQTVDLLNISSSLQNDFDISSSSDLSYEIKKLLFKCRNWFGKSNL